MSTVSIRRWDKRRRGRREATVNEGRAERAVIRLSLFIALTVTSSSTSY